MKRAQRGMLRACGPFELVVTPVEEQTILVTGATDGLGRALARELASRGASPPLHGRSDARLDETRREIARVAGPGPLDVYRADLASLDEVRGLAEDVERDHERLDLL